MSHLFATLIVLKDCWQGREKLSFREYLKDDQTRDSFKIIQHKSSSHIRFKLLLLSSELHESPAILTVFIKIERQIKIVEGLVIRKQIIIFQGIYLKDDPTQNFKNNAAQVIKPHQHQIIIK